MVRYRQLGYAEVRFKYDLNVQQIGPHSIKTLRLLTFTILGPGIRRLPK